MRQPHPKSFLFFTLLILVCSTVSAESLQDEYAVLTARRAQLENRAAELRKGLAELERKTIILEVSWQTCANGRWRFVWNSTVTSANESRYALEAQRERLFALNKNLNDQNFALDQKRRKIEHDFPIKGFKYESAFREFMHALDNEYLSPLENEYFHGFEWYLSGVRGYHAFVEYAIQACNNNDVAPLAIEQGLRYVNKIVDVVTALKNLFNRA